MKRLGMVLLATAGALGAAAIVTAVALLMPHAPTADAQWDDPAVAACEWLAQRQDVLPAQNYQRISAKIDGNSVVLAFHVSALNTAPEKMEKICSFEMSGSHIVFVREKAGDCDTELAAYRKAFNWETRAPLQECSDRMTAVLHRLESQIVTELPLVMTGIYPIDPTKTKLQIQ